MPNDQEMRTVSARIEALIVELETLSDPDVRSRVEELVRLLLRFHGEGLARMLRVLDDQNQTAGQAVERCAADPVVASLLMLHDLHPHDLQTRVAKALDILQPAIGAQAGLTLLTATPEAVRVRLDVATGGCGASLESLRAAVDAAIRDAAPDVSEVDVETAARAPEAALLQISRRP
jgi:Fe-S cluster biogenesis protein NfuA